MQRCCTIVARRASHRALSSKTLSHVDATKGLPRMVDVSNKTTTTRKAIARCRVVFPPDAWDTLTASGFAGTKGPVLATAVVAGVGAASLEVAEACGARPLRFAVGTLFGAVVRREIREILAGDLEPLLDAMRVMWDVDGAAGRLELAAASSAGCATCCWRTPRATPRSPTAKG